MALVQYNYIGNPFAERNAPPQVDKITGWFQVNDVDVPRPTPYINYDITSAVKTYSFTDGVQAFVSTDPTITRIQFLVTLDAAGNMVRPWYIKLEGQSNSNARSIFTFASEGAPATDETLGADGYEGRVDNNPGFWMPSPFVAQFFGFFNGVHKTHYDTIVAAAPFDKCNLLTLAFVRTVPKNGDFIADFIDWRDNCWKGPLDPGDTDADRVNLVVQTARQKNPSIKILISLGYNNNDLPNAARTPERFANSVRDLVQKYNLDGFDIDFEGNNADVEAFDLLAVVQKLRQSLSSIPRPIILTITPGPVNVDNPPLPPFTKEILDLFAYIMPQTYDGVHNGMPYPYYDGYIAWLTGLLGGSYAKIVYGLSSEGFIDTSPNNRNYPQPYADEAKGKNAAGIFAWRLDNDSLIKEVPPLLAPIPLPEFPTFWIGLKMWDLMHPTADTR